MLGLHWVNPRERTVPKQTRAIQRRLSGVDSLMRKVMRDWNVPGVGLAVIADGEVALSRGYGLRDIKRKLPVQADTIFPIASVTKSFTAFAVGLLVDEGKLEWDKPVRDYLPEFRLHDEAATARIAVRDLLSHRTGLPRHDGMWALTQLERSELFQRLRHLPPSADLRALYQYNNLMFMAAGMLIQKLAGQTWEEFVGERIFQPLGMRDSTFAIRDVSQHPRLCTPYWGRKGEALRAMPHLEFESVGPAGTINSTVEDLSRWLSLHLHGGKLGRKALIRPETLAEMHSPQTVMPGPYKFPEIPMGAYGMGWMISVYRGYRRVEHGGNINGFTTRISMLPDEGLGVVFLCNRRHTWLRNVVEFFLYDRLLGLEPRPWSARFKRLEREATAEEAARKKRKRKERKRGTRPSRPLAEFAGSYEHPGYGAITIRRNGRGLAASYGRYTWQVKHYHYDSFDFLEKTRDSELTGTFVSKASGEIEGLLVKVEPAVAPVLFAKQDGDGR